MNLGDPSGQFALGDWLYNAVGLNAYRNAVASQCSRWTSIAGSGVMVVVNMGTLAPGFGEADLAKDVLSLIEENGGKPLTGYVSKIYRNISDPKLPGGGSYIEHDIYPSGVGPRGAARIIIDQNTGKAWYTPDHYKSFIKIR